jgi:murein hydrolase activator
LVAGEPVGTMPAGEKKPHLYLELRHDGQPINPLPWLATHDEKVSG